MPCSAAKKKKKKNGQWNFSEKTTYDPVLWLSDNMHSHFIQGTTIMPGPQNQRDPIVGFILNSLWGNTPPHLSRPVDKPHLSPDSLLLRYTAIYLLSSFPIITSQLGFSDLFLFIRHIFMKGEEESSVPISLPSEDSELFKSRHADI